LNVGVTLMVAVVEPCADVIVSAAARRSILVIDRKLPPLPKSTHQKWHRRRGSGLYAVGHVS